MVHEVWNLTGEIDKLSGILLHYSHANISEYIEKTNFYTNKEVLDYDGPEEKIYNILLYPVAKFIKVYFFQLGFLDGVPGLIYAWLNARYSFYKRKKIYIATKS